MVNNIKKRGTKFPVSIQNKQTHIDSHALMDTGATRSCMNYSIAYKMGKSCIRNSKQCRWLGLMAVT